ncbi:hypothetical protein P692DRAFT_20325513 [Suillus brevipes Sb2]|nr:hypothetical protein P692DRAFT_20325513 [Suillus brevipes Sb2]
MPQQNIWPTPSPMHSLTTRLVDHIIAALVPQVASVLPTSEAMAKTAQKAKDIRTSFLDKVERIRQLAWDERSEHEGGLCSSRTTQGSSRCTLCICYRLPQCHKDLRSISKSRSNVSTTQLHRCWRLLLSRKLSKSQHNLR